jgi:hypothetical protein
MAHDIRMYARPPVVFSLRGSLSPFRDASFLTVRIEYTETALNVKSRFLESVFMDADVASEGCGFEAAHEDVTQRSQRPQRAQRGSLRVGDLVS